jgi:hypothetical protein
MTNITSANSASPHKDRGCSTSSLNVTVDKVKQRMLTPTPELAHIKWAPGEFEALWDSLPPPPVPERTHPLKGSLGKRVQEHMRTTLPEPDLREFAREVLGAKRMSAAYLEALRITLGNQAHAERYGRPLEMNIKTPHAPSITERTMRTIIEQMTDAGIIQGVRVGLGEGRTQVVQRFFQPCPRPDLEALRRLDETPHLGHSAPAAYMPVSITEADVPF